MADATPTPGSDEIRAAAAREGLAPPAADIEVVRDFLAVFLPAVEGLAALLPPGGVGAGPAPLGRE
jgi:hypothetical protein